MRHDAQACVAGCGAQLPRKFVRYAMLDLLGIGSCTQESSAPQPTSVSRTRIWCALVHKAREPWRAHMCGEVRCAMVASFRIRGENKRARYGEVGQTVPEKRPK